MKVKFYGVRGSMPACGEEYIRYGGNTTCLRILREDVNRIAIIDAGSGIRNLGKEIVANGYRQNIINILFSHFHWDHIQGLPFFAPAYDKDQKIGILVMGKARKIKNTKEIFSLTMQQEYFPVELDKMGAAIEFLTFDDKETFYGATVTVIPQHHKYKGGSYGFRIEDNSGSLVVCTDVEHPHGIDEDIVNLARDADVLIHDGQYTPEEYNTHRGWGHSSWKHAAEVATRAGVRQLVITHHDPDHTDEFLDDMEIACQRVFPNSLLAKEGMEIVVDKNQHIASSHPPV